jgi:predicted  nucleic acid-binding Zn-ribbon protein
VPNILKNLAGCRFDRILVLHRVESSKAGTYWKCKCDCGHMWDVRGTALTSRCTKSCGCLTAELLIKFTATQKTGNPARKKGTLAYFKTNTWGNLKKRTVNMAPHPKNASYIRKGIELRMTKDEFYQWCDLNSQAIQDLYANGKTPSIDRINSNGHYEITNLQILDDRENKRKQ